MNKDEFNSWLTDRIEAQTKVTIGGVVAMVGLGLLAFLIQGGLLWLILSMNFGGLLAAVMVIALFAAMGYFVFMTAPKKHRDSRHKAEVGGKKIKIRVAPTMANAWTFALGSTDIDQSILERAFGLMFIVPRMFWTAWSLHKRVEVVRDIDVPNCGKILRMLLRKAERVNVDEIAEKFPSVDLVKTLREVSLIDGVVFLTKESVGLSLANRFKDELEQGLREDAPPAESAFDGS